MQNCKFREIFRFEFRYQLRHVSTWLLISAFFLFGFLILRMVTLAGETQLNAPGTITFFTVFGSVIWIVIGGVVAGDTASRDVQTHMHSISFTTPVSRFSYLGARFLAALLLNALILLALYSGFILSLYGPGAKSDILGPFRIASYVTNFSFIALPAVIATTSIQFTFAALSGRAIASYVASILIIIFSQFGGTTVRYMLEWKQLGSMMDLLGTSIVAEMEGWTPIDKNTRLILLEGTWLWNRVMWLSIAAGALVFTYFRFRFEHATPNTTWSIFRRHRRATNVSGDAHDYETNPISVPAINRDFVFATYARQVIAIARSSFRMIARSRGGLTLVAVLAIGTGLFSTEYMEWLGVPLFARTEEVLRILTPSLSSFQTQWIIIPLLTIFYTGELVWREREAGVYELSDTAPVPESVMFLGKFLGLALVITTWVALMMVAGIINQLVMDYPYFEIGIYIKALFGIQLINYLLFALLIFAIHVVVNQKYIGHMAAFCAYGFIICASMMGIEHNMLIYASDPGWSYSDMRGFGPFIKPWLWFKVYWASWAFLLALIATLFWVRSRERGFRARFRLAQHRFAQHKLASFLALAFVILSGGFIFYNTNVLNEYTNKPDRMEMRAEYERRYGQYENTVLPVLARANLNVEIYPDKREADMQCSYHLVNQSKVAIDSIHLSTVTGISAISFDRLATAIVVDDDLGYYIYSLGNPLKPGDSLQMNFEVHIKPHGFSNDGVDASVVANGSHISSDAWMPVIGYNENRRLRNASDRENYRLPPRPERPSLEDFSARYRSHHADQIDFEAIVGTNKDQVAVAPGTLRRTWTKGGRQYFHYVTNAPIHNDYAFFSARYKVREVQWVPPALPVLPIANRQLSEGLKRTTKPVTIQVYHHPSHNANVERMVKSAQASLEYYSQEFGPYPYSEFRVLERPGPGRGMHADAMTIDYEEGYSLMNPAPGGHDLPYHIMAHEMAHQWWGLELVPAAVEGAGLLVESLATYSAMQVVEETLGYEHLLRYLSQMRQEYEIPRSRATPPLLRANNAFLHYRKGPFALFALRNYIGKDRVNDALRRILRDYTQGPPLATTLDLYKELKAVTPDSLQYLVHDLFAANTFWELKTEQATAKQTEAGGWQVTLDVQARKVIVDEKGVENEMPMNDWIEIGVFGAPEEDKNPGKLLYSQKHRIRPGRQTITVTVTREPVRGGIDPNYLLIDLVMGDNVRKVNIAR